MVLPVTIVTGFLGSGKSTLLNHMLNAPEMAGAAVIINEFGEISVDHLLIETSIENAMVLQNGCICCTVRGDLVDTLLDLEARRGRGEIPEYDKVVIETTGLAETAPILQTLLFDAAIAGRYTVGSVITTVDAVNLAGQISRFQECRRQIAFATVIGLTKTDLASSATVEAAQRIVQSINPAPPILSIVNGETDYQALLAPRDAPDKANLKDWLGAEAYATDGHNHQHEHVHGHDHDHDHADGDSGAHLGDDIQSFCLTRTSPMDLARLKRWLLAITSLRGDKVLRVKGVVNIQGIDGPVVIQGVQHVLYPPKRLPDWPDADHSSRVVFITQGLPPDAIRASAAYLGGPEAA